MPSPETTIPTAHSATDWHVGALPNDLAEVRMVLRSKEEARAWAVWLFDHAGMPDAEELVTDGR